MTEQSHTLPNFVVLIDRASNQSMKLTASLRGNVNALATGPARGLSLFR
jgi:SLT domain-containing protein